MERAATGLVPNRASAPKYSSLRVRAAGADTLLEDDDEPLSGAGYGSSARADGADLDDGGVWLSKSDSVEGHRGDRTIRASVDRVGDHAAGKLHQVRDHLGRIGDGVDHRPTWQRPRRVEGLNLSHQGQGSRLTRGDGEHGIGDNQGVGWGGDGKCAAVQRTNFRQKLAPGRDRARPR